jgi:anti-sigma factor RsiW
MKPIEPAEISALIDGELPTARAEEVRQAIAGDPSLRRAYDELLAMDADLRSSATQAMFPPRVALPETADSFGVRMFLAAAALVLLRVLMKLSPPELSAGLATALLAVVVGWVLWFLTAGPAAVGSPVSRGTS